jgi:choline dehydrogenase-like flavoprotein
MATEKTDVVIVGVGAAGGVLAAELGKAGMKVIGLERGPRLTTQDFDPHDELRYFQRQDLRPKHQASARHLAAQRECAGNSAPAAELRQSGRRRHRPLRRRVMALPRG